jgi:hypothetical protein
MYAVKVASGRWIKLSTIDPTVDYDSDAGFSVGDTLLSATGLSFICTDSTVGAAVWADDTEYDALITQTIRSLTELIPRYCDNYFMDVNSKMTISNLVFTSPNKIVLAGAGFNSGLYSDDTLWIFDSLRNDGVYDIDSVDADEITLIQDIKRAMTDAYPVVLFASSFPDGLRAAVGKFGAYDVWTRPGVTPGLSSERIGTYQYTRLANTGSPITGSGGMDYPSDLLASIVMYKRPRIR